MNSFQKHADLVAAFEYDGRRPSWSGWHVMSPADPRGDCEDFAVTAWLVDGWPRALFRLVTFQDVFWFTDSHDTASEKPRHTILWRRGYGWTGSTYPEYQDSTPHQRIFPWPWPVVLLAIAWGKITG